ncbi:MAG: hypothetical protein QF372_02880 [Candidatus Poseidoniia archaeon]|nr:hypothetical protein [Candidatus Poseidoniia archaeon]
MRRRVATQMVFRPLVALLTLALLLVPPSEADWDPYVSHPGYIPDFHNFTTPQMTPGESGQFTLEVTNRYAEPLENVIVSMDLYMRADIEGSEVIDAVAADARPRITEGCWMRLSNNEVECDAPTGQRATFSPGTLAAGEAVRFSTEIQSTEERSWLRCTLLGSRCDAGTAEGTYFVRFMLEFDHNGTARSMLSRGHWSMAEWETATTDVPDGAPGNINLTALGVDGVIPDSSFGVKEPIPKWPLYVLIGLTMMFAGLAVVFYLEEEGTYPKLNKWLQQQRGKLNQLRLRLKHRERRP